jgi:alanine racemase
MEGRRPTWAEVDLDIIAANLKVIRKLTGGGRKIFGVVKADAYGHGSVTVARCLQKEGIHGLGVACVEEGLELRRAGIDIQILILGAFDRSQVPMIVEAGLTPTVYSMSTLSAILEASARLPQPIQFHLKIDSGMGRIGFTPGELSAALDRIAALQHPALQGVYTTLSSSDQLDNSFTSRQLSRFNHGLQEIKRRGLSPALVHMANSGGIINAPETWLECVRPGLALFGLSPSGGPPSNGLRPALSLHSRVILLKTVPPDTPLGYGGAFKTSRESRIATIAAGYDDGLKRQLHDGGEALLGGKRVPYVGRISMDLAMLDVTDVDGAAEGNVVTIIGTQGEDSITASELARHCGTISWEILCGIGRRVPRIYQGCGKSGEIISAFN